MSRTLCSCSQIVQVESKTHCLVLWFISPWVFETQSVFLFLIMRRHYNVIPWHGNGFCSARLCLDSLTSPGHLIPSSHLLMSRLYGAIWDMRHLITSIMILLNVFQIFIVLWLDYYFVFLSGCELPSKGMKSQAASRSHGTFHLLNLHQNIQQKPPLSPLQRPTRGWRSEDALKCSLVWLF